MTLPAILRCRRLLPPGPAALGPAVLRALPLAAPTLATRWLLYTTPRACAAAVDQDVPNYEHAQRQSRTDRPQRRACCSHAAAAPARQMAPASTLEQACAAAGGRVRAAHFPPLNLLQRRIATNTGSPGCAAAPRRARGTPPFPPSGAAAPAHATSTAREKWL